MANIRKNIRSRTDHRPSGKFTITGLIIAATMAAAGGAYLLGQGQAATYSSAAEAESGNVASPAITIPSSGTSGNTAVKFGPTTTNPGGSGCTSGSAPAPCIGGPSTGASGWSNPVFSDDFNDTNLNTSKWAPCWFPDTYPGSDLCGAMNESRTARSNVKLEGGSLILTQSARDAGALVSSNPDGGAGTGFLLTTGYYAEARVYFPGNGTTIYNWPAWWLNGPESGYGDGEHDIAEGLGTMTVNYHSASGAHNQGTIPGVWSNAYHIYGIYRQANKADVYYDGQLVKSYATDDNGGPQYLIFNVGTKESRTMVYGTQSQVKVDYVRVWRK